MIAGKQYDGEKLDVWCCGVILYAMICGFLPFDENGNDKVYEKIINADFHIPSFISISCADLLQKILEKDPEKRINI